MNNISRLPPLVVAINKFSIAKWNTVLAIALISAIAFLGDAVADGMTSQVVAKNMCISTTTNAASYMIAVDRVFAVPMVKEWADSLDGHGRMVVGKHIDKTEYVNGQCYWSISIYESDSSHMQLWKIFRVGIESNDIYMMDDDGNYIPIAPFFADDSNCLSFLLGKSMNHEKEFIESLPFSKNRAPDSEIYSAMFDLNKDGNPEYFYYLEDRWFCGVNTGCTINVYEYKNGRFRELFNHGIPTFNQFDPRKVESKKYICIASDEGVGWSDITLQQKRVFRYNGNKYSFTKGGK